MRNLIAAFCLCLLAPETDAQQPADPAAPRAPVELQLPEKVGRDLSDIATALRKPPAAVELQLSDNTSDDLGVIANEIREKREERDKRETIPKDANWLWWTGRFSERWFWLWGFLLLAGSSAVSGRRDSKRAVFVESKTRDIRSYRDLIREGKAKAQAEHQLQTASDDGAEDKSDLGKVIRATRQYIKDHEKPPPWPRIMFGVGSLMLIGLAGLPNIAFGFSLVEAKTSATDILNSPIATAFTGAWLALIYFATSQSQRRSEAEHDFTVVSDETSSIEAAKKSAAYKEYELAFDAFGRWRGTPPPSQSEDEGSIAADERKYRLVEGAALRLGQGTKLQLTDDEQKFSETSGRYTRLMRTPWLESATLGTIVQNLLKESDLITEYRTEWEGFARGYGGNNRAKWEVIRSLAEKLEQGVRA